MKVVENTALQRSMKQDVKLKKVYKLFRDVMKDFKLIPVEKEKRVDVKPYQLRSLSCSVPNYWLLVLEAEQGMSYLGLYKVLILTEDICLAHFDESVPFLRVAEVNTVACLPFWVYLTKEFLEKYSIYYESIEKDAECVLNWAMSVKLPVEKSVRGKYIRDVMKLMSGWNLNSILSIVDRVE